MVTAEAALTLACYMSDIYLHMSTQ